MNTKKAPHELTKVEIFAEVNSYPYWRFWLAGVIVGKRRWKVFHRALLYMTGRDDLVEAVNKGTASELTALPRSGGW